MLATGKLLAWLRAGCAGGVGLLFRVSRIGSWDREWVDLKKRARDICLLEMGYSTHCLECELRIHSKICQQDLRSS